MGKQTKEGESPVDERGRGEVVSRVKRDTRNLVRKKWGPSHKAKYYLVTDRGIVP